MRFSFVFKNKEKLVRYSTSSKVRLLNRVTNLLILENGPDHKWTLSFKVDYGNGLTNQGLYQTKMGFMSAYNAFTSSTLTKQLEEGW